MSPPKGPGPEAWRLRRAGPRDFPELMVLEVAAFDPPRRQTPRAMRHGLQSASQAAWLLERGTGVDREVGGLLILLLYPKAVRVYDIAVHPKHQGHGLGRRLMAHTERVARQRGAERVTLEADPKARGLVAMYEHLGYEATNRLPGYYGPGRDAVRMVKRLR